MKIKLFGKSCLFEVLTSLIINNACLYYMSWVCNCFYLQFSNVAGKICVALSSETSVVIYILPLAFCCSICVYKLCTLQELLNTILCTITMLFKERK